MTSISLGQPANFWAASKKLRCHPIVARRPLKRHLVPHLAWHLSERREGDRLSLVELAATTTQEGGRARRPSLFDAILRDLLRDLTIAARVDAPLAELPEPIAHEGHGAVPLIPRHDPYPLEGQHVG
ncbi:protein of unknown function [Methylorubrum extorquens]|uniref:Uncharacterized protein n=1 Tax=Methylorubrum extorquens TaxID=408 RepID=A0A2N9AHF8_METEX|nr:protein of unknown function [Methylorubrum extorquens]